jgi:hypothetical protein
MRTLATLPNAEAPDDDHDEGAAGKPAVAVERDGFNLHAGVRIEPFPSPRSRTPTKLSPSKAHPSPPPADEGLFARAPTRARVRAGLKAPRRHRRRRSGREPERAAWLRWPSQGARGCVEERRSYLAAEHYDTGRSAPTGRCLPVAARLTLRQPA